MGSAYDVLNIDCFSGITLLVSDKPRNSIGRLLPRQVKRAVQMMAALYGHYRELGTSSPHPGPADDHSSLRKRKDAAISLN